MSRNNYIVNKDESCQVYFDYTSWCFLSLSVHGMTGHIINRITDTIITELILHIAEVRGCIESKNTLKNTILLQFSFLKDALEYESWMERLRDRGYVKRAVSRVARELKLKDMTRRVSKARARIERKHNENKIDSKVYKQLLNRLTSEYKYSSRIMLDERQKQLAQNDRFLATKVIVDKSGKEYTLGGMKRQTQKKFSEYYMQIKAMEQKAQREGKRWMFITLTCPPRMHPNPTVGKRSYDGTSIEEAKKYLNKRWNSATRHLNRRGIELAKGDVYGFKVIEPHMDGCPHLHVLLFVNEEQVRPIMEECFKAFDYINALTKNGRRTEKYVEKMRKSESRLRGKFAKAKTQSVTITLNRTEEKAAFDNGKTIKNSASAATYISKYLLKTFEVSGVEKNSVELKEMRAVDSWRACANARAFSSIGMKGVIGKWKEAKKVDSLKILEMNGVRQEIHLLAKGAVLIDMCSLQALLKSRPDTKVFVNNGKQAMVATTEQAHESYLKFVDFVLSDSIEIKINKQSYTNKYEEEATRSFGLIIDDEISEPVRYEVKARKYEVPRLGSGELSIYYPSARPAVCASQSSLRKSVELISEKTPSDSLEGNLEHKR